MIRSTLAILSLCVLLSVPAAAQWDTDVGPTRYTWNFRGEPDGDLPDGWETAKTGGGSKGRWEVRNSKDAPSGKKVLAQLDKDGKPDRCLVASPAEPPFGDVAYTLQVKPIDGRCGAVLRFKAEKTYYAVRLDPAQKTIALLACSGGGLAELASAEADVQAGKWGKLEIVARDSEFAVSWRGKQVLAAEDSTIGGWGQVGVWTEGSATAEFDDLVADPKPPRRDRD